MLIEDGEVEGFYLDLPVVGKVDLATHSLVFSTVLIGFLDGVNPCSLWVLSLLLALVVSSGSRRRTILVGLNFLVVACGIYALIIIGLFSVFRFMGWASPSISTHRILSACSKRCTTVK